MSVPGVDADADVDATILNSINWVTGCDHAVFYAAHTATYSVLDVYWYHYTHQLI